MRAGVWVQAVKSRAIAVRIRTECFIFTRSSLVISIYAKLGVLIVKRLCQAWRYKSSPSLKIMQRPDPESAYYEDFSEFQAKLSARIVMLRRAKGYKQEDMLEAELSRRHYQRMEEEPDKIVSLWQVYKIARALEIDIAELLQV